jgi:hypothetical protein
VTMLAVPSGQSRKAGVGRRWAVALLAAWILLLTWGLNDRAWAAAPKDPTPPKLVSVTFSPSTVAVSGLDTVPVTVGLRLTDDSGVVPEAVSEDCPDPLCDNPGVYLAPVGGGGPRPSWRALKLTSGTPRDGIWSTTFAVPSTWNGQWQVRELFAADAHENLFVDPTTIGITSKLTVVGVHQPRLSMGFSPNPVWGHGPGKITVKGRAYFADTGKPIPGLSISKGEDGHVGEGTVGDPCWVTIGPSAVTNAQGGYSIPADTMIAYLEVKLGGTPAICQWDAPDVEFVVSAAAARASVCVGQTVPITGQVLPAPNYDPQYRYDPRIFLQRLVSGQWRTVGTSRVRYSGRYTLTATPPTLGNHRYRVYTLSSRVFGWQYIGSISHTVLVGTARC